MAMTYDMAAFLFALRIGAIRAAVGKIPTSTHSVSVFQLRESLACPLAHFQPS